MKTMFEQLMAGLDEVEAYLQGEREGFRVTQPVSLDEAAGASTKCGDYSSPLRFESE